MAPWDQLSTKDRNMVHSKSETLFESMCKCRIRIPLKILLLLDQKISKIEPETAELALSLSLGYRVFHFGRDKFLARLS